MSLLRRANEQSEQDWRSVPEGLWRWVIGTPELKLSEKFGNYQVRFPLQLTADEQKRVLAEHGAPPEGVQQSYRTSYSCGLSLGYVQRDGQYKSTKLVDFLAATLGSSNTKKFREWIAAGGGPPQSSDKDQELKIITEWLTWFENLELYGSIRHETGDDGREWARFGGPMPVGSLPGQRDDDYQALGRGKLRAIIAESEQAQGAMTGESKEPTSTASSTPRTYEDVFPDENDQTAA